MGFYLPNRCINWSPWMICSMVDKDEDDTLMGEVRMNSNLSEWNNEDVNQLSLLNFLPNC